ncbi:tyrosine-type recombinase/integrase [Streptomyces pseudovenezuelae]|uniref:tyrosine-type recombinase/integrase n=1 Tax=Streptomyces pseudovenezuelae TaxID=67350 RepID=UPI002E30265F|nr:site-specific integrase [Streptomyces pseudovenezuelae]
MGRPNEPFDRWHKTYPKPDRGEIPCRCGTTRRPLYPSSDHGRGLQWQARYADSNGKQYRRSFAAWQECRDHLDNFHAAIQLGTSGNPGAVSLPVEFYARQLIERRRKRNKNANTTNTYESHLRNHILPFAGHRPASALRRRDSTALVDWLLVKPSLSSTCTVVQIFKTWRILVHYMLDEDVPLPSNVVARIDLPDVTQRVAVVLSPRQVAAIAAAMRKVAPRYEILIWLAACAGLRQGEAFGLRRSQVMQSQDRLCIKEQRQRGKAVGLKTKASYATLPVDHFLIEQLTQHSSQFVEPELVSPYTEQRRRARGYAEPPGEGLIVTNRFGRPVLRSDFHDKWKRAVRLAGLPRTTRFHDLKHFYTTTLGSSGNHDPKTVQALSRHAEFSETWDTYAHPPLAVEHVTVTAFSSAFAHIAHHSSCREQP